MCSVELTAKGNNDSGSEPARRQGRVETRGTEACYNAKGQILSEMPIYMPSKIKCTDHARLA